MWTASDALRGKLESYEPTHIHLTCLPISYCASFLPNSSMGCVRTFFACAWAIPAFTSSAMDKINVNSQLGHYFVAQKYSNKIRAWQSLLIMSTQCLALLYCEKGLAYLKLFHLPSTILQVGWGSWFLSRTHAMTWFSSYSPHCYNSGQGNEHCLHSGRRYLVSPTSLGWHFSIDKVTGTFL